MEKELTKVSKYLSFLLRHQPEAIGLKLDDQGWACLDELIGKTSDFELDDELIKVVVETNDKQRFALDMVARKIRANQGHSIDIDLALQPVAPPDILLHGTADRFIVAIMSEGLTKQKRHHVHLSESESVASAVGQRYGNLVLLKIDAKTMYQDGYQFFRSANNVWLVDSVAPSYIKQV